MKEKLAKAFILFSGGSIVGILTQVIKGKVMAVILGTAGIGIFSQLTKIFSFTFTLGSLGFKNGTIKTISESLRDDDHKKYIEEYSSVTIFLALISSIASSCGIIFSKTISHLLFDDNGGNYVLVSIIFSVVPVAVLTNSYKSILSGHLAVKKMVKSQILSDLFSIIPFLILIYYFNLLGATIAFCTYQVLRLCFFVFFYSKEVGYIPIPKRINFLWSHITKNLKYGISGIFLGSLNLLITLYIGRTIIAELGSSDNGLLSVALRVSTLYFGAIYANASSYYFPLLVKARNKRELQALMEETNIFYMYLLPPIIMVLMCFGELIIHILFSADFKFAGKILMFFLLGDLFRITNETRGLAFLAKEKFKPYNLTYIIWGGFYILIAIFLLNKIGILGVSIAYLISHFLSFLVTSFFLKKELQIGIGKSFIKIFLVALSTCSLVLLVNYQYDQAWIRISFSLVFFMLWFGYSYTQNDFKKYLSIAINKLKKLIT
jgi:antigen flippase